MPSEEVKSMITAGVPMPGGGPSANGAKLKFVGVPAGYAAPGRGGSGNMNPNVNGGTYGDYMPIAPKYGSGMETTFGASKSPEDRARIQQGMMQAGLYGANGTFRLGLWDENTQAAFSQVLAYSNQNGLDAEQALQELIANPLTGPGSAAAKRARRVTQLTPTGTLEQSVQTAALSRLGRRLRPEEVQHFTAIYNGLERTDAEAGATAQDGADPTQGATDAGGEPLQDTTVTPQAPGVAAGAAGFIDHNYAQEAAGQDAAGYFAVMQSMMGGKP